MEERKFPMYKVVRDIGGIYGSSVVLPEQDYYTEYSIEAFVAPKRGSVFVFDSAKRAVENMWSSSHIDELPEGGYRATRKLFECEAYDVQSAVACITYEDEILDTFYAQILEGKEPDTLKVNWNEEMMAQSIRLTREVDWQPILAELMSEGLLWRG